ncbi:MAG: S41 family peptidase [Xanthomonadales bacterium]|jgi:carboxyl-terminal processing protease|nr:S41 family peptidase [Xanthomonadales bacterium]MDH3924176.1 S41 family peptidase [Xanthomonadales bacterium]MDH3940953.1 S41 family peptidase [Xanthomonadales bacterium]MDH4000876.1 S41 family peptidase [Xanthomonadales bacterium]
MTGRITKLFLYLAGALALSSALAAQNDDTAIQNDAKAQAQLTLEDLRTFTDVFNQARNNYVEEVDDKTLLDAAIRGMLLELDPHSSYLPAKKYEELNDASKGRYSGIGIDVETRDGKIYVRAIINGSPADEAGLNPGDMITSINGQEVRGRYLPDAIDEIGGDPETDVVLIVQPAEGEAREVTITRAYVQVPALSYVPVGESFGYFRLTHFHNESSTHLKQSLESIKQAGTTISVLILDLRNNPGGVLRQAVGIADGFLDEGVIVSTRGRNSKMQMEFNANPGQWLPGTPVILLVDRGTASASEVLSGALQDHQRALIVGERTFGKGSVQSVLPLRNGAGIKLTTALYYTPSGRSIQAQGIEPDVAVDWEATPGMDDERIRESDLEGHLEQERAVETSVPLSEVPADYRLEEVLTALREANLYTP